MAGFGCRLSVRCRAGEAFSARYFPANSAPREHGSDISPLEKLGIAAVHGDGQEHLLQVRPMVLRVAVPNWHGRCHQKASFVVPTRDHGEALNGSRRRWSDLRDGAVARIAKQCASTATMQRMQVWSSLNGHEGESRRRPRRTWSHRARSLFLT